MIVCFVAGCGGGSSTSTPPASTPNPLPAVTEINPSSVIAGSTDTAISITGTGFISGSTAQWNGATLATTYSSATKLSATLPANDIATASVAKLTVVNPAPGGGTSASVNFSIDNAAPAIASITPASVLAGSGDTSLDIIGSGFVPSTSIGWNGLPLVTTFVSASEVRAALPSADLAGATQAQITAVNPAPGGGTSSQILFVVDNPVPTLTSVSPASLSAGVGSTTLDIKGTNFLTSSVVMWNNAPLPTKYLSSTELTATLPAADLTGSSSN